MRESNPDQYLSLTEIKILDEVGTFHAKGNFTLHEAFYDRTYLHQHSDGQLSALMNNELRLSPGEPINIPDPHNKFCDGKNLLARNESCSKFKKASFQFDTIVDLVRPMLSRNGTNFKRYYPSAGALYPIEAFIFNIDHSVTDWPFADQVLHVLSNSKSIEPVIDTDQPKHLKRAILPDDCNIGEPSIAIIYIAYAPKSLFKYRYRGYRFCLMEAGSLYMLMDLHCKSLKLSNRMWSGYTDTMICKALGLNPALFFPLAVQLIGRPDENFQSPR